MILIVFPFIKLNSKLPCSIASILKEDSTNVYLIHVTIIHKKKEIVYVDMPSQKFKEHVANIKLNRC